MTITEFITHFRSQFDYLEDSEITIPETIFQEIDGWDSLTALMILDMIDDEFSADITGEEMRACSTLQDLYELASRRATK